MGRKRSKLKAGDILAAPRKKGGYYYMIYITSNMWGYAYGLFDGHGESLNPSPDWAPSPIKHPIYSGNFLVANGCWKVIDNRGDLLGLFPESPPIYHEKSGNMSNDRIGPYGSAEIISGELTDLTESEADEIGLTQGVYRQIMLEDHLERTLG